MAWQAGEKRKMTVTVLRGRHMPKKDIMGKCDPFVILELDGKELGRSEVKKNTYDPDWGDKIDLDLRDEKDCTGPLILRVMDYDSMTGSDFVGETELSGLFDQPDGTDVEHTVQLKDRKGEFVVGTDNKFTEVTLNVRVDRSVPPPRKPHPENALQQAGPKAPGAETNPATKESQPAPAMPAASLLSLAPAADPVSPSPEAQDAAAISAGEKEVWVSGERRRMIATAIQARHLPKKDIMGKCDPFVSIDFGGKEVGRTEVKKSTYDPDFDAKLEFGWTRSPHGAGPIVVHVFDHDRMTASDDVGEATVDSEAILGGTVGAGQEVLLKLQDKKGKPVIGNDKQVSEVSVRFMLERSVLGLTALAAEQEAWVPNERRRIVATVVSGRHMPKKDMMGSCDPVAILELLGEQYRTQVQKGTYDPNWDDRLELGWVESAEKAAGVGRLVVRIVDHNVGTGDQHIGVAVLDGGLAFLRQVGEENEVFVELVDEAGRGIVGHDGHASEVKLRLNLERSFGAALTVLAEEEAWISNERRRVVCTVVNARHLPKKDLMGTCDAFAVVSLDGKERKTKVVKGTYDPDFEEVLELGWARSTPKGMLCLKVFDDDMGMGEDYIGQASLDSVVLFKQEVGKECEVTVGLIDREGKPVIGKDKLGSELKIRVKLERSIMGLSALASQQEAWVPNERRRIVVTVVSGRHMPKKETMGSCDPVCEIELLGNRHRTRVQKDTYDPNFQERLELGWVEGAEMASGVGNLILRVSDHDIGTGNDFIGEAVLDGAFAFMRKVGEENEVLVELVDKEGKDVVGNDGQVSEIKLRFNLERLLGLSGLEEEEPWVANERRRVVCTVVHARHLPQKDMMGTCDPFVIASLDGKERKTQVVKGNYDPDFEEVLDLGWASSAPEGVLTVKLMDHDTGTGEDYIGEATLEASRLYRQVIDKESEITLPLVDQKGKAVVGNDKLGSEVKLRVKLERSITGLVALASEQEAWLPNERRRIVATVMSGRHMPKKNMMGSCDPVCVLELMGEKHRTRVVKGSYDPDWEERLELGWIDKAEQVPGVGSLVVRVFDHDMGIGDDLIGEAVLDGGLALMRKVGEENEVLVELVDKEGKGVIGHDGQVSEMRLLFNLERSFGSALVALEEEEAWVPNERRRVVCTIESARHLPKKDMMGTCDPFVIAELDGLECKTQVVKGTYDPDFEEVLELGWVSRASVGVLTIKLMDHDIGSEQDYIGEATLDASVLFKQEVGKESEMILGLVDEKKNPVSGHDKLRSEIKLRVKLERSIIGLSALASEQEAWEPNEKRRIIATVASGRHMPKKDMIGLCDPVCEIELLGHKVRTQVQKGTYDPNFDERLELGWVDSAEKASGVGNLILRVFDHSIGTGDKIIGEAVLDGSLVFLRKIGEENDVVVELVDKKGKGVVGKDGKGSEMTIRFGIERELSALKALEQEEAWVQNERRRVVCTVVNARSLPKKDMMGKCDPYVIVSLDGKERKTKVVKGTYDPDFEEVLELGWARRTPKGMLCLKVFDDDMGMREVYIGEASIKASLLYQQVVGEEAEVKLPVLDQKGNPVIGESTIASEITVRVKLERSLLGLSALASEQEAWVPNERRRIVATVVSGRHMPKKDMMGSCDPVAVIELLGEEFRTQVQKGTYEPVWNERLELGWIENAEKAAAAGDLVVRVSDYDIGAGDDLIGEGVLDGGLAFMRKVGEENEVVVELFDQAGKAVLGYDGQVCEIKICFGLERLLPAIKALDKEEAWVPNERRRVVCTVVNARHLPKMDMMGTCDAFVAASLDGKEQRTQVVKGTCDPVYGDILELGWVRASLAGAMVLKVLHHDVGTGEDFVGETSLEASELFRQIVGEESEVTLALLDRNGKGVVGNDNHQSEITVRVKLERSTLGIVAVSAQQEAWAPNERRRIVATVIKGRHLPKSDMFGLCDPYVEISLKGKDLKTGVRKNTLSPDWDERLDLEWVSSAQAADSMGPLVVRLADHDVMGNEFIGAAKLDSATIFRGKVGEPNEITVEISDRKGRPVEGKDKRMCELKLKFMIEREIVDAGSEQHTRGRRLIATVVSGRHLPKLDMLGLCDPFVELVFKEVLYKTGVRKNTLSPDWNEKLELPWVTTPDEELGPLIVRVFDYDTVSSNDFVGEASVDAPRVAELLSGAIGSAPVEVCVKLLDKESAPVVGKDKRPSEIKLKFTVEGQAEWGKFPAPKPASDAPQGHGKRFPIGEGMRLGYAVDSQAKHANWTKKNGIVVNSNKETEARLRALAAAQARNISSGAELSAERDRQGRLAKAAMLRQKIQSARGHATEREKKISPRMPAAPLPKEIETRGDYELDRVLRTARHILQEDFIGGSQERDPDPYPELQSLKRDPYPTLESLTHGRVETSRNGENASLRPSALYQSQARDDHDVGGDELLLRARALLAAAGAVSGNMDSFWTPPSPPMRNPVETWGVNGGVGEVANEDGEGDEMQMLSRIREVVRGLNGGGREVQSEHDYDGVYTSGVERVREVEAGSFSNDSISIGEENDTLGPSLFGGGYKPEPMAFASGTSTVTLRSVDGSVAGDSVFGGGVGKDGGRMFGAGDEIRLCVFDLKVRGLAPAGEGVKYALKMQLQGYKARTAQVEAYGSEMHWYDKCEFEVDAKEESRAGGMTLRVRLVKTKKGRAGTAPVDSVVGECAVKVKPLQGKTRRAQWQWHTFNTGNQQQSHGTPVELYVGIETLTGFAEPSPPDLPPSLAFTSTAPRPPGQRKSEGSLVVKAKEMGTSVDERELEAVPAERAALALQCAWRSHGARKRIKRAEAWRVYGVGSNDNAKSVDWRSKERREGAGGLYSTRRQRPSPPEAFLPPLGGPTPSFDQYVGAPEHPTGSLWKGGKAGGASRRALALNRFNDADTSRERNAVGGLKPPVPSLKRSQQMPRGMAGREDRLYEDLESAGREGRLYTDLDGAGRGNRMYMGLDHARVGDRQNGGLDPLFPLKGHSGGDAGGRSEISREDAEHWDRIRKSAAILLGTL